MKRKQNVRNINFIHIAVIVITCSLFLLPFLSSSGYSFGGDDLRLYYLYPREYLTNFIFQVMSANGLGGNAGYLAASYNAPLIGLFFLVHTFIPIINLQHLFYGLNLSLGFLFCYLFFQTFNTAKKRLFRVAAILASCVYISSPYIIKTLYQSELIPIYLVMLVPIFFYTFTRGLQSRNIKYIVGSAVLVWVLSSSILSLPWLLPCIIVCLPYIIYSALKYKKYFWFAILVFFLISFGLNWYWLVHGILSIVASRFDKTLLSFVVSSQFIQDAENMIYSTMFLNGPTHQIAGYLRTSWDDHRPMPVQEIIGASSLLLITLAGIKLKNISKEMKVLFGVMVLCLCIAIIMITPNMGTWNMDLFLFLNRFVPMFAMFRNMFNKFGLAFAFVSSWLVYFSCIVLIQQKKRLWTWITYGLVMFLLAFQLPQFFQSRGVGKTSQPITQLSHEYQELTRYLTSFDTTKRFLWYPMNFPGYTPIQDEMNKDLWYLGLSPLQILAEKSDIVGFYGLQTSIDQNKSWKTLELLQEKKYEDIVSMFETYNVGYVIMINGDIPDALKKQLDQFSFMSLQTKEYREALLGEKITDIGTTYSIYTLKQKQGFDTAFLTNDPNDIHALKEKIILRLIKTNTYEITLPAKISFQSLVLLTPYNSLWNISIPHDEVEATTFVNHRVAYGYGNVWDIQRQGNREMPITVTIEFLPDRMTFPSVLFSCLVCVGSCMYICFSHKKEHEN